MLNPPHDMFHGLPQTADHVLAMLLLTSHRVTQDIRWRCTHGTGASRIVRVCPADIAPFFAMGTRARIASNQKAMDAAKISLARVGSRRPSSYSGSGSQNARLMFFYFLCWMPCFPGEVDIVHSAKCARFIHLDVSNSVPTLFPEPAISLWECS